ncbi:hypothetical protein P9112_009917 [Eukaryota sp. TZLM1-RC]
MTSSSTPRYRESFKLEPPPGFKTHIVNSNKTIWRMVKIANKKTTTNMDVWCGGCGKVFAKQNTCRWGPLHIPSCSGWENTKELSMFLAEQKVKKAIEEQNNKAYIESASVSEAITLTDPMETNDFFVEDDVQATLGKKACLAFALSGISFNTIEKESFQDFLRYFAQIHRSKQVKPNFLGPNRQQLSNSILPKLHQTVKLLIAECFIPSLISHSFELSIDGYSTGMTPRHNIIAASNGRSFYIGCIPADCREQNQDHLADIIVFGATEVAKLIQIHSDPNLVGLTK